MNIIEANKISKRYIISHQKQNSATSITEVIRNWRSNHQHEHKDVGEEFWALKDVSFSIKKGERVGIIGKNGSGKSTLLKILSQITHPTSGEATIHGRVASLLEVGSGFHPELTGRENIYLNGAILGMRRKEILTKFDGIVDFAEIEKFLDTPVKYYSSGMYVRLAFAVASHLEPDILIADEVLAVGDADFQKKCVSKMVEIGNTGTTILYVSHNLNSVKNLCDSAILLSEGKLITYEKIDAVINAYLNKSETKQELSLKEREDRRGNQKIRFTSINFSDANGNDTNTVSSGQSMGMLISFSALDSFMLNSAFFAVSIINQFGERISALYDEISDANVYIEKNSTREVEIHINNLTLVPGKYSINLYSKINNEIADWILNAEALNITPDELDAKRSLVPFTAQGLCYINHSFKINIA